jgi:sulfur carrier protein
MELMVNGETRLLERSMSIAELLESHNLKPKMVVVERNRIIVPRELYDSTQLLPGDEIEIVQMMAGG